jgi:predicted amidohydrolase YtcJ
VEVFEGVPDGERVELGDAVMLPGLVDAHIHVRGIGATEREVDLRGTRSMEEIAERVRAAAGEVPAGTWIRGRGWDQNDWGVRGWPTHEVLDAAAPEHPVWLTRVDGHAVWVNARALALARIEATTAAPSGGEILRDQRGAATGVFIDNAIDLVEAALPPPSREELRVDLERGLAACVRAGLTGVHDMGTTAAQLEVLRELEAEGRLPLRFTAYLGGSWEEISAAIARPPDREGLLRVMGVKMFADGALGSRGAALLAPYADRPESAGLLLVEPAVLAERVAAVDRAGYQVAIHAIGDRGNRVALDAIEAALRARGGSGSGRYVPRHRVEHAQVVALEDLPRFARLGVVASMQPTHATSDMPWAEARVGPERIRGAYAWRTLLGMETHLAFGSDAPVEGESPFWGIYAAISRQDADGQPAGGWRAQERLTVAEAIAGFTTGAAFAAQQDADPLGVIRAGAPADFTVVDRDPFVVEPAAVRETRVVRTIVAGREVYP